MNDFIIHTPQASAANVHGRAWGDLYNDIAKVAQESKIVSEENAFRGLNHQDGHGK